MPQFSPFRGFSIHQLYCKASRFINSITKFLGSSILSRGFSFHPLYCEICQSIRPGLPCSPTPPRGFPIHQPHCKASRFTNCITKSPGSPTLFRGFPNHQLYCKASRSTNSITKPPGPPALPRGPSPWFARTRIGIWQVKLESWAIGYLSRFKSQRVFLTWRLREGRAYRGLGKNSGGLRR